MTTFRKATVTWIRDPSRRVVYLSDNATKLLRIWNKANPEQQISRSGVYYAQKNGGRLKELEVGGSTVEGYRPPAGHKLYLINAVF